MDIKETLRDNLYREMCGNCPNARYCKESCEDCEDFLNELENECKKYGIKMEESEEQL